MLKTPTALERIILEHVERYRMTVPQALSRVRGLERCGRKRLRRALRSLIDPGLLGQATLYGNRRYYYSTESKHAEPRERCGPFSEQAKIRRYAMLAFCCLGRTSRLRLTEWEFAERFPELHRSGLSGGYYLDPNVEPQKLGLLRVDVGGRGRWDRIIGRCRRDLFRHATLPSGRALLQENRFELTLLTATEAKVERLQQSLLDCKDVIASSVRLCVMPELIHLLAPDLAARRT